MLKRPVSLPVVASAAYAALAAQAVWGLPPSGFTLCPIKLLTGHDCPGCGMGHAIVFAMRGDFSASLRAHPLGLPFFVLWTAWLTWGAVNVARGRDFSERFFPVLKRASLQWAVLAVVLAAFVLRRI